MDVIGPKRHTQKTGDISEQAAITRLLECGYTVLQPIGQMHRYDLVIEDADGKFWKIQCKTGWLNEDQSIITFAAASSQNYTVSRRDGATTKGKLIFSTFMSKHSARSTSSLSMMLLTQSVPCVSHRQRTNRRRTCGGPKTMNCS